MINMIKAAFIKINSKEQYIFVQAIAILLGYKWRFKKEYNICLVNREYPHYIVLTCQPGKTSHSNKYYIDHGLSIYINGTVLPELANNPIIVEDIEFQNILRAGFEIGKELISNNNIISVINNGLLIKNK